MRRSSLAFSLSSRVLKGADAETDAEMIVPSPIGDSHRDNVWLSVLLKVERLVTVEPPAGRRMRTKGADTDSMDGLDNDEMSGGVQEVTVVLSVVGL